MFFSMSWLDSDRPIIGLSPMADFTDSPFCVLIREAGGKAAVFREMLAAEALVRGNEKTLAALDFSQTERPIVQQLFGSDPGSMAKAAEIVMEKSSPDGIDINMGCPVYKAVSNFNGASLMREPERAANIIKAIKSVISVPLSVKTRLGWSRPDEIKEFSKIIENAGADAIEIHARTKEQAYAGKADWTAVAPIADALEIPVLINGDIMEPEDARQALEQSHAAGFLVGRGALGRPWIFKRLGTFLRDGKDEGDPELKQRLSYLRKHAELQLQHFGPNGLIQLRKHFPWYFKGIANFRQYRAEAVQIKDLASLDALLEKILIAED